MTLTRNERLVVVMRENAIKHPALALSVARKADLELSAACAMLTMETGGGRNVFGHDPTPSIPTTWKGAPVTRARYAYYKLRRGRDGRGGMQGVGPCQLTWYETQDEADRLGGCWRSDVNMLVGFRSLRALIATHGEREGFARYNGTGPAAEAYGRRAKALRDHFHAEFARATR